VRRSGVILAIDYGQKRLGLALSDESGFASRPFATWTRTNRRRDLARLRELVKERHVKQIVIGLPLHLDGTPSEMSEEANAFARRVQKALGLPVELMDERLSSWEAKQEAEQDVREAAGTRKPSRDSRRGEQFTRTARRPLDELAAAIILRDYLEKARAQAGSRD
jgi:putative Holliday junction resolvase